MANDWTFELASPQDLQPYYDPSILNDPGFDFSSGFAIPQMPTMNFGNFGGGQGPAFGAPQMPPSGGMGVSTPPPQSFNPAQIGPPPSMASAGPAATAATAANAPIGAGLPSADERGGSAPKVASAADGGRPGQAPYRPGSAAQQPQQQGGGFDWKKMLAGIGGNIAGSGTQALIGGGMSLLGQALSPKQQQQQGGGAPAPAPSVAPVAPTTPTGTPNMGTSTPPSGAQWSPLLNKPATGAGRSAVGLEAQKRMRRGGQTGGMALY